MEETPYVTCKEETKYAPTADLPTKNLKCSNCDFNAVDLSQLKRHRQCYKMCCPECGFVTSHSEVLYIHRVEQHGKSTKKEDTYKCTNCDFSTSKPVIWLRHRKKACFPFKCQLPDCVGFETSRLKNYQNHMKTSHSDAMFKKPTPYVSCHLCPLEYHPLATHSSKGFTHEESSYQCSNCTFNTESKNKISTHMKTSYTCFRFKCPKCKFRGYNEQRFKRHNCTNKINQNSLLVCQECDFNTQNRIHFTEHVEAAHEGIVHRCKACLFNTSFKSAMKEHERAKHPPIKQYDCKSCSFRTNDMQQFRKHINSEHLLYIANRDGSITCLLCSFTPSSALRNSKITIKRHVKYVHNKEKDVRCNVCMENFVTDFALKLHKERKHGELNGILTKLPCTYSDCKYIAKIGWLLNRHVDAVHKGKRFPCTLCDYSGCDKRATLTHTKNKHIKSPKPRTPNLDDWQNQKTKYIQNQHQKEIFEVNDCNEGEIICVE